MKLLLFFYFLLSALFCAYFMIVFIREVKKSVARQEPIRFGVLILAFICIIIMLIEAIASATVIMK